MRTYRITLIVDHLEYPSSLQFLKSPQGIFAREMNNKKFLEASEGSLGHLLMTDFAKSFPTGSFKEEIITSSIEEDIEEVIKIQQLVENAKLAQSLKLAKVMLRNIAEGL